MAYIRKLTQDVKIYDPSKACNGYTLFSLEWGRDAWLINMRGQIVNHWAMKHGPAAHGKLLPNGNLLWQGRDLEAMTEFGSNGKELVEVDWDSNQVWRYDDPFVNHDFVRLSNGNTVLNRYVQIPDSIAAKIKGGIPGTEREGKIWSCSFREITKEADVVWEWKHYEHLDPERDILCPLCPRSIWGYTNSLDVFPNGNIVFTLRFLNTIAILDKKTGEIIWRWGPEHSLGHPHSCSVLDNGNILLFDNGLHRKGKEIGIGDVAASRVIEVNPKTNEIEWEYRDPNAFNFYTAICGGAERLPNGNTLICESTKGRFFEVTSKKDIVWEYVSPFMIRRPPYWGWTLSAEVFQAHRYGPDYEGLNGKALDPNRFEWVIREKSTETLEEEKILSRLKKLGY
jgi:hypothetical protein